MVERLFISQSKLEAWIEEVKVTFEDNVLTLLESRVAYRLEPAVRVLKLIDGKDNVQLVGKMVTVAELVAEKGEHYPNSLILGDTAYECEEGFMGTAQAQTPLTPTVVARAPAEAASPSSA